MTAKKIELYDTTLRDGSQSEDISFTVEDKIRVAEKLDELGIHYIEGGWPGANPKDDEFFLKAKLPKKQGGLELKYSKLAAFGSTRRGGVKPSQDKILQGLVKSEARVMTIFGKSWDFHVRDALGISLQENLDMIEDSIRYLKKYADEVIYDAEHLFDGYKENPEYTLKTLQAAVAGGADRLVLCDTNGGSMPDDIEALVQEIGIKIHTPLGIHCHNDSELAVANSLAAVRSGAIQIHGTINGIGERCGNANLVSIIPALALKMGLPCVSKDQLKKLREVSRFVDELANRSPWTHQPYVGESAFAHKGGMHVSAILKNQKTYEHIFPEVVGNKRRVLISDLSGISNIIYKAEEFGIKLNPKDENTRKIVEDIKRLENEGYEFEGAEASFEIIMKRALKKYKPYFTLVRFRVVDEMGLDGKLLSSEATVEVEVGGEREHTAARGVGPVNALDHALRKSLERFYPQLKEVSLVDYKVRVLPAGEGTASQVRVMIESKDASGAKWSTVGVSENIIEASWQALVDAIEYKLMKS